MKTIKVLIVEDECIIAWDLKRKLERLGAEVVSVADTAEKAVAQAKLASPELILMDISLKGGKTGIEAAMEIRRFSDAAIVYLTGNDHLADGPEVTATRAQGVYSKPPAETQIRAMLRAARASE